MNNLFSGSFSKYASEAADLEMQRQPAQQPAGGGGGGGGGANLDKFFADVENVKDDLKELEELHRSLQRWNERSKTVHQSAEVKEVRSRMDADVSAALRKAKVVKLRLEALDRANAANRSVPGCGPGSSTDRTRTSIVAGLRKKLADTMEEFDRVRERTAAEYREAVERRYYTVTGEKADEKTLDSLTVTGEAERFLQRAIQEGGGRGEVMEALTEIREREESSRELERSLAELHQVFLDMAVLVEKQGDQINDIESNVGRASSFVRDGTDNLQIARTHQKNTRKWTVVGILTLLIVLLIILVPILVRNSNN